MCIRDRYTGHCRTHVAGALCGGVTVVVGLCWNGLHLPGTSGLVIRICEGILVTGFIYVVSRLVMMIPDWEPRSEMPVVMYAPGGRRLNEYAAVSYTHLDVYKRQLWDMMKRNV